MMFDLMETRYGYNYRIVSRPKERLLGVSRQTLIPNVTRLTDQLLGRGNPSS